LHAHFPYASLHGTPIESVIRYGCRVKQRASYRMSSLRSVCVMSLKRPVNGCNPTAGCAGFTPHSTNSSLSIDPRETHPASPAMPGLSRKPQTPLHLSHPSRRPSGTRWMSRRSMKPSTDRSLKFPGRKSIPEV
jgi:hypothetical protein